MNNKIREFEYKCVIVEIYESTCTLGYYHGEWRSYIEIDLMSDEKIKMLIDVVFNATRAHVKTELNKLLGI